MKTSIRINNHYVLFVDNNYYLTDIDQLDELDEIEDFSQYLDNNPITDKVKSLLEEFEEEDNVNFILSDGEFNSIKNSLKIDPLKAIQIKKGGG